MSKEALAFDTSRYVETNGFNKDAWIEDLSGLSLEAAKNQPLHKRINPFTLEETLDGRIINALIGEKDVSEYYSFETHTDTQESLAGIRIRDSLLNEPEGSMVVWISPAGGENHYDEARIVIGFNETVNNLKAIRSFGIPTKHTPSESLIHFGTLALLSTSIHPMVYSPEDIRSEVLVFHPNSRSHMQTLRSSIPMDEIWDAIESGEVYREKISAKQDTQKVWNAVGHLFENARTHDEFIRAGAAAEQMMSQLGRKMTGGPCGKMNSEVISKSANLLWQHVELGQNEIEEPNDGKGSLSFKCSKGHENTRRPGKFRKTCKVCGEDVSCGNPEATDD